MHVISVHPTLIAHRWDFSNEWSLLEELPTVVRAFLQAAAVEQFVVLVFPVSVSNIYPDYSLVYVNRADNDILPTPTTLPALS